ncbi:MAG: RNA-binding protein [Firmicutes bacterium]|nr:RNA-binding protein [Bacillota bacterium]
MSAKNTDKNAAQAETEKRFRELAQRADSRSCYVYSDFLDQAQQSVFARLRFPAELARLWGGFAEAERKIACFGGESICGYAEEPPLACLHIAPLNRRFAGKLGHRDYLGALLNLGIRREKIGDILVGETDAYVYCKTEMVEALCNELTRVGRISVSCTPVAEAAADHFPRPQQEIIIVSSCRLDALLGAVYKLSRQAGKEAVEQGTVFVDDMLASDPATVIKAGSKVSVRGRGRFFFQGITGETQKGRLRAAVHVYR